MTDINLSSFIWSVADLLRGDYKQSEYGRVPTVGTGGMLSVAEEHLHEQNPGARLVLYGQELNPASYAICKADMLIKGQDIGHIVSPDIRTCRPRSATCT